MNTLRPVSAALIFSVVLASPGPLAHRAAAAVLRAPVRAGGTQAGAAAGAAGLRVTPRVSLGKIELGALKLSAVTAKPGFASSISPSAIAVSPALAVPAAAARVSAVPGQEDSGEGNEDLSQPAPGRPMAISAASPARARAISPAALSGEGKTPGAYEGGVPLAAGKAQPAARGTLGALGLRARAILGAGAAGSHESAKAAAEFSGAALRGELSGAPVATPGISFAARSGLRHGDESGAGEEAGYEGRAPESPKAPQPAIHASLREKTGAWLKRLTGKSAAAPAEQKLEHPVYDIQAPAFRAGYTAALAWRPGTDLAWRGDAKARRGYLEGLAYRIAESRGDESAARGFLGKAEAASAAELNALAESSLASQGGDNAALRERLAEPDFVQGYLTSIAWRPGKQLWMPAPSWRERLKVFTLRARMQARDAAFMDGVYAGLRARGESGAALAAELERELASGPAVGSSEFATKLGFALETVLRKTHDETLDKRLPLVVGEVRIPRSYWGLIIGHRILIIFGINLHMVAQPFLVYGLTDSKAMMGVIRSYHYAAYSGWNLVPLGPAIDRADYRTMLVGTALARALLMGAIPLLFLAGHLSFAVLALIVVLNPYWQSFMTNGDSAAEASILGTDETVVREGTAFSTKVTSIAGLVMPAIASYVVALLTGWFGEPGGYAMAYGIYAAALVVAVPVFLLLVRDPRYHDPEVKLKPSKNPLYLLYPFWIMIRAPLKALGRLFGIGRPKAEAPAAEAAGREGAPAAPQAPVRGLRGKLASFLDRFEAMEGVAVILRSDTLSLLMVISALQLFVSGTLGFVVLPNYIIDVIHPTAAFSWVPVVGSMLGTKVGIMGLLFTAQGIGTYLGARWAGGVKGGRRIKHWGHKTLYRATALSGLTYWALMLPIFLVAQFGTGGIPTWLFLANFGVMIAQGFLMALLSTPLLIAMSPVRRKQIPNDKVGKVAGAFTMIDLALVGLGAYAIGLLVDHIPIAGAVALIAFLLSLSSVLEWLAPRWLGRINPPAWEHGERGGKKDAAGREPAPQPASPEGGDGKS